MNGCEIFPNACFASTDMIIRFFFLKHHCDVVPASHTWNKSHLAVASNYFYTLLNSVFKKDFYIYVHER